MCIVYIDDIDCFKFSIFHHQNGTRRINSELERFVEFYQNLMYGRGPQKMWGLVLGKRLITTAIYGSVSKPCTPVVHIKIAGKWMFIPLKMVLIGIDP